MKAEPAIDKSAVKLATDTGAHQAGDAAADRAEISELSGFTHNALRAAFHARWWRGFEPLQAAREAAFGANAGESFAGELQAFVGIGPEVGGKTHELRTAGHIDVGAQRFALAPQAVVPAFCPVKQHDVLFQFVQIEIRAAPLEDILDFKL
ncbi:hypothetical protein D3C84_926180 [compost metagenome]